MENKLDAILMEIKTSKSIPMKTNPRSEMNEIESMQPSGSKGKKSMGVNASDNKSIVSENEDIPLKTSEMRDLRHPAEPIHQNDTTLDSTVIFNEESDEEDYHSCNTHFFIIHPFTPSSTKSRDYSSISCLLHPLLLTENFVLHHNFTHQHC